MDLCTDRVSKQPAGLMPREESSSPHLRIQDELYATKNMRTRAPAPLRPRVREEFGARQDEETHQVQRGRVTEKE